VPGKTTLVRQLVEELLDADADAVTFVGDDLYTQSLFAPGSASFGLADRQSEPLTGRAHTFHLHPLQQARRTTC